MASKLFEDRLKKVPNATKKYTRKSLDIIDQIHEFLDIKGMTQKDLADKLGKSEAEISKWLSGGHNITLKTLSKIEDALGEEILVTPIQVREEPAKYLKKKV